MDYLDIGFDFGLIMDFTLEEISQQRTLDKLSRQRLDGLSRQRNQFLVANAATSAQLQLAASLRCSLPSVNRNIEKKK